MTSSGDQRYVHPGEAAKLLHVSARTLDRWATQGRIPCMVTLGGHRRFRLDDVVALAERMHISVTEIRGS